MAEPPALPFLTRIFGEIPFPEGSPSHAVWTLASRQAAEEAAALEADALRSYPDDLVRRRRWAVDLAIRKFDIQAKAIMAITVTDFAAVAKFEVVLSRLAEAHAGEFRDHPVPALDAEELADKVRLALAARSADWVREALRQARDFDTAANGLTSPEKGKGVESGPGLASWADVRITFVSEERVRIESSGGPATRNYAEMGFEDLRNGRPNRAWQTLMTIAKLNGTLPDRKNHRDWPKFEKRIQEIRQRLRRQFRLDEDPLPFTPGTGYVAAFSIKIGEAFET